jgi:hypothetical protein
MLDVSDGFGRWSFVMATIHSVRSSSPKVLQNMKKEVEDPSELDGWDEVP